MGYFVSVLYYTFDVGCTFAVVIDVWLINVNVAIFPISVTYCQWSDSVIVRNPDFFPLFLLKFLKIHNIGGYP